MKRFIQGILPFLLLVLALTFMTEFKQLNDLTDSEKYEVRSFVEAAEANDDQEKQLDSSVVSSSTEEVGEARDAGDAVDPNKTYAITSDDEMVTVYDNEGNVVFQATLTDWEENREAYYEKYRLGSS